MCGIIHIFFFCSSSNSGSNYNSTNINSWPIDVVEIVPVRNFVLIPEPQYKQQCQCSHWFRISKKREKKCICRSMEQEIKSHQNHKPMGNSMTRGEKPQRTGKVISLTSSVGKTGQTHMKMKLEHFLIPHTKVNSTCSKELNVKPNTAKLLKENIRRTLYDMNLNIFFIFWGKWNKNKSQQKQQQQQQSQQMESN